MSQNVIDLQKFCYPKEHQRYMIHKPFSFGEYTYATDGSICIRVPRIAEIPEANSPHPEKLFDEAVGRFEVVWQSLPPFELVTQPCVWCKGKGYTRLCRYCEGHGCARCDDGLYPTTKDDIMVGEVCDPCEECNGTPIEKCPGDIRIQGVKGNIVKISAIYLDMIKDLPNVQIAPYTADKSVQVRFDGGIGLIMPMRITP